eukprot:scaffold67572_cov69-Phaeocystis_antarctica.AAC.4
MLTTAQYAHPQPSPERDAHTSHVSAVTRRTSAHSQPYGGQRRRGPRLRGKRVEHQLPSALQVPVARVRMHGGDCDRPPARLCRALPASARCGAGAAAAHVEQRLAAHMLQVLLLRMRLHRLHHQLERPRHRCPLFASPPRCVVTVTHGGQRHATQLFLSWWRPCNAALRRRLHRRHQLLDEPRLCCPLRPSLCRCFGANTHAVQQR